MSNSTAIHIMTNQTLPLHIQQSAEIMTYEMKETLHLFYYMS